METALYLVRNITPLSSRAQKLTVLGFQIGGEFNALISIKVRDETQKDQIAAQ